MTAVAEGLASRGIATLRYQFPYMERGIRRPDPPQLAQGTVRAAVEAVRNTLPAMPSLAGGKSFGGRMTSQAQAAAPLPSVVGLPFLAFPLHPIGKPTGERAVHLSAVCIPMLFVQGTRDGLTDSALLATVLERLGRRATLVQVPGADHSFHVPAPERPDRSAGARRGTGRVCSLGPGNCRTILKPSGRLQAKRLLEGNQRLLAVVAPVAVDRAAKHAGVVQLLLYEAD